MHKNNRNFNGRFGRKSLNWTAIWDTGLFIVLGIWISFSVIDIALKAHGL